MAPREQSSARSSKKSQRAFTRVDFALLCGFAFLVSGMALPMVQLEHENADRGQAMRDTVEIAEALHKYQADTGFHPTGDRGTQQAQILIGPGRRPDFGDFRDRNALRLRSFLISGDAGGFDWRGPYVVELRPDPWGNAYFANVAGYHVEKERIWVISAGPNGRLETHPWLRDVAGDDVGVVLRK